MNMYLMTFLRGPMRNRFGGFGLRGLSWTILGESLSARTPSRALCSGSYPPGKYPAASILEFRVEGLWTLV